MFFGAHVSASGGIHTTLDRAEAMRADAVQLFTQSPRMWRPTNHDPANLERFRERRAELGIAPGGVLVHAIYLVNLAAPDKEIYAKSRTTLRKTMEVACAIEHLHRGPAAMIPDTVHREHSRRRARVSCDQELLREVSRREIVIVGVDDVGEDSRAIGPLPPEGVESGRPAVRVVPPHLFGDEELESALAEYLRK